ncbi:MAG TPA: hypothetical protein PLQ93_09745 [Bacteroidia bacterium]|nr:hypothetical protein [Bacteroidia bacterium]
MRLRAFVIFSIFLSCLEYTAQSVPLRFQGNVSEERSRLSGVSLQIAKSGRVVNNVITDASGNYAFELPMNGDFMITVSKEGYVSKKFSVSTMGVPGEKANSRFPIIEASLTLFKRMEGIDYSLLSQPVNKYYYNIDRDNFEYDENHLKQMLKGLESIKAQEKLIKDREKERDASYAASLKVADKAFGKKEWETALKSYNEASEIKPEESYPKLQIENINKARGEENNKQKALEDANRLAREKARADSIARVEADKAAKLAVAAAAAKALEDKKAKEKAEADLAAKKKADADALAKKQADAAAEKARTDKALQDKLAADKAKMEADALARKQADEAAEKARKEKELQDKANSDKAKLEAEALARKQAEENAAKLKAEQDKAQKQERDRAKAKSDSLAQAKKQSDELAAKKAAEEAASKKAAEEAAAKKAAEEAAVKAKSDKTIYPVIGATELRYKEAIRKADAAFSMRRYYDAKTAYEEALVAKSGDVYAKMRLMECEKIINADASQKVDERQKMLLAKYPPGITEEVIPGEGVVVIKRVLVKNNKAFVYEKKVFNWGGVACFRDGDPITELTFEQETRKEN